MPNGSLEKWLYSQNSPLNILQRLNKMIDVASALEYLHHGHGYSQQLVHCDVKPSNIPLDDDMVAHVADFGLARLLGGGDSMTQTMTLATIGYMAPEFGMEGVVSTRRDVYSFGVVLMETFTKRKANR
ncbi:probable LRR receptor-like serine/threonine-protein kinase At3g47570 [Prunus avium]|uniref:Probable LRR receptor-like serine/threonine-protein kinase At3g47570 n=1 Tax=Prunus avium TaxID=42229 RepID=A0A6P5TF53_PRUAV|nr:probable LRR receptor-like serine/threonine-protein kinase At3g47570 [Prunus avium]